MDKKVCLRCNIEKNIDEFRKFKNRDGSLSYRNVCRLCLSNQVKMSQKKQKEKKAKNKKLDIKTIDEPTKVLNNTKNLSIELDNLQKEKLLKLINKADLLIDNIDNKVEINLDEFKSKRTIRSFNIDDNLYKIIKEKSNIHNISISDFVNLLIKKGLDFF